jgi:ADP-heptose:LPS heptosyltransferase
MGDCLLATSPLRALKFEYPGFRVSVLVEPRFADCFHGNPDVDEILVTSERKYQTFMRLLGRRFHAIVNLHGGPTSLSYGFASWGRRIGLEGYQYSWLYSGLAPSPNGDLHTVESTMEWFRWLGVRRPTPPPLRYADHPEEAAWVRATIQDRPYVVLHPAAILETKRWSTAGFASVGRQLAEAGWCTVLTSGPGEEGIVGETARDLPSSVILLGLTIPKLAELIRGARLYIGNDSGPMHLAAAVGTPTVAVWGSSDSRRWRPWSVPHRIVQNPFDCNPCAGYRCEVSDTPLCIESVTSEQVGAAVEALLKETGAVIPAEQTH